MAEYFSKAWFVLYWISVTCLPSLKCSRYKRVCGRPIKCSTQFTLSQSLTIECRTGDCFCISSNALRRIYSLACICMPIRKDDHFQSIYISFHGRRTKQLFDYVPKEKVHSHNDPTEGLAPLQKQIFDLQISFLSFLSISTSFLANLARVILPEEMMSDWKQSPDLPPLCHHWWLLLLSKEIMGAKEFMFSWRTCVLILNEKKISGKEVQAAFVFPRTSNHVQA